MSTTSPTTDHRARLDVYAHAGPAVAGLQRAEQRIELDPSLRELIRMRASQLNACAYCLDLHWREATAAGEDPARLGQLPAFAESPCFTDRERAVLALTDAVTLVAQTHVPDDVWAAAERHLQPAELAAALLQIATINAWNRIAVASRRVPTGTAAEGRG